MQRSMTVTAIRILLALVIVGSGCAFAPSSRFKSQEKEAKGETEEVEQAEDFDPLSLNDDDVTEPELEKPGEATGRETEEGSDVRPDTLNVEAFEQVQGYRVQIFLSSNLENAQKIVEEAHGVFSEQAYLEYDAPYYKVRIGDCLTRREADLLREKGYAVDQR